MENSLNQNKVWGWGELALMYFPNISQKSATMQLLKWIRVSDELVGQLEKSGWHPGKKYLTPRQKDYIVGHLGGGRGACKASSGQKLRGQYGLSEQGVCIYRK